MHTGMDKVMHRHRESLTHFTGQEEASHSYQDLYVRVKAIFISGTHVCVKDHHCCLTIGMGQAEYYAKLKTMGDGSKTFSYL